jgi:hypothetical protein
VGCNRNSYDLLKLIKDREIDVCVVAASTLGKVMAVEIKPDIGGFDFSRQGYIIQRHTSHR